MMHNLFGKLPQHLKDNAYLVGEESAWIKDDALGVIDFCKEQEIAVLGGEVWLPTQCPVRLSGRRFRFDSPPIFTLTEPISFR